MSTFVSASNYIDRKDQAVLNPSDPSVQSAISTTELYRAARVVDNSVSVPTGESIKILSSPTGVRNLLMLRNASAGTQNIFIGFNKQASTLSTLQIVPGQLIVLDSVTPQDDLYIIADAASAVLCYAYSNVNE